MSAIFAAASQDGESLNRGWYRNRPCQRQVSVNSRPSRPHPNSEVRQFRDCHRRGSPDHRHLPGYLQLLMLIEPPRSSGRVCRGGAVPCRTGGSLYTYNQNPSAHCQSIVAIDIFISRFLYRRDEKLAGRILCLYEGPWITLLPVRDGHAV